MSAAIALVAIALAMPLKKPPVAKAALRSLRVSVKLLAPCELDFSEPPPSQAMLRVRGADGAVRPWNLILWSVRDGPGGTRTFEYGNSYAAPVGSYVFDGFAPTFHRARNWALEAPAYARSAACQRRQRSGRSPMAYDNYGQLKSGAIDKSGQRFDFKVAANSVSVDLTGVINMALPDVKLKPPPVPCKRPGPGCGVPKK